MLKLSKFQILSDRRVIYLKRNLRTYIIKAQQEKVRFPARNYIDQFSESSEKRFQKCLFWNLSTIKRNKVMFRVPSPNNPVETVEGYMLLRAKSARPHQE